MALEAHGVEPPERIPDWKADTTQAYIEAIIESTEEVDTLRSFTKPNISFHFLPPGPDIWLIAPGIVPNIMQRLKATRFSPDDQWAAQTFVRRLERQKVFGSPITEEDLKRLEASPVAAGLHRTRNAETGLFATAIGVRTAGSLAMTLRMMLRVLSWPLKEPVSVLITYPIAGMSRSFERDREMLPATPTPNGWDQEASNRRPKRQRRTGSGLFCCAGKAAKPGENSAS